MKNSCFSLGYRKALSACAVSALSSLFLIAIFAGSLAAPAQSPKELHIAAAADLQPVLPALAAQYEQAPASRSFPPSAPRQPSPSRSPTVIPKISSSPRTTCIPSNWLPQTDHQPHPSPLRPRRPRPMGAQGFPRATPHPRRSHQPQGPENRGRQQPARSLWFCSREGPPEPWPHRQSRQQTCHR